MTAPANKAGTTYANDFVPGITFAIKGGVTGAIADGTAVSHGFHKTPEFVVACPTVATDIVSVNNIGSEHFHVAIKAAIGGGAGTAQVIYWIAGAL